jgi:pyruvate dehydrogenase E1 component beta subunit
MFVDFIGVCLDQILNNAAKMRYMYGGQVKVPFTLITRIGAGTSSAAQHSEAFYSIFSHIPGLKGVVPSDPYSAKGLLISAIRDDDPVIFFEHKLLYPESGPVPEEPYALPIGKARIMRPGNDITLVGISRMTRVCLEVADTLAAEGVDAEVVDLMSISPIDYDLIIESVRKTHRIVVVDEDTPRCSVATDICAAVAEEAFDYLDCPPSKVTAPHTPVPFSRPLEQEYIPNPPRVLATVRRLLGG